MSLHLSLYEPDLAIPESIPSFSLTSNELLFWHEKMRCQVLNKLFQQRDKNITVDTAMRETEPGRNGAVNQNFITRTSWSFLHILKAASSPWQRRGMEYPNLHPFYINIPTKSSLPSVDQTSYCTARLASTAVFVFMCDTLWQVPNFWFIST